MRFEKPGLPGIAGSTHNSSKIQLHIVQLIVYEENDMCNTAHNAFNEYYKATGWAGNPDQMKYFQVLPP